MSSDWHWDLLDAGGAPVPESTVRVPAFPTQSEAESWVGEEWPALVEAGVDAVTLREGDAVVYGPMSLRAAD